MSGAGIEEIMKLASSRKAGERNEAVRRLKSLKLSHEEYSEVLGLLIESSSEYARRTAVKAAPVLLDGDREILRFSEAVLRNESWQVREAGANILRNLKQVDEKAMNLIEEYSEDKAPIVNRTIGDTIAHLHLKGLLEADLVEKYAGSGIEGKMRTAAFALRRIYRSRPETLKLVRRWALKGGDSEKWTAVYTLKLIGKRSREAAEILKMVEGSPKVTRLKAKALREISEG